MAEDPTLFVFPKLDDIKPVEVQDPKLRQQAGLTLKDLDDPRDPSYLKGKDGEGKLYLRLVHRDRLTPSVPHVWSSSMTIGQGVETSVSVAGLFHNRLSLDRAIIAQILAAVVPSKKRRSMRLVQPLLKVNSTLLSDDIRTISCTINPVTSEYCYVTFPELASPQSYVAGNAGF